MKKIIFVFLSFYNLLFSEPLTLLDNGTFYNGITCMRQDAWFSYRWCNATDPDYFFENNHIGIKMPYGTGYVYNFYNYTYVTCPVICTSNQTLINGVCVDNIPTCPLGEHNDETLEGSPCVPDYPIENDYLSPDTGSRFVSYADGVKCLIKGDFSATCYNTLGDTVPNRYYDGQMPTSINWDYINIDSSNNSVYKKLSLGETAFNLAYNAAGDFAAFVGAVAIMPFYPIIQTLYHDKVTDEAVQVYLDPSRPNAVKVDLASIPDTPLNDLADTETAVANSPTNKIILLDGTVVEKVVDTSWAGSGNPIYKYNVVKQGDSVFTNGHVTGSYMITSPDTIKIATIQPDNSLNVTEISKNELASNASANTDINYIQKNITAPSINNDGTTSSTTSTSVGTIDSKTGATTTTTSDGNTTIKDPAKPDLPVPAPITPNPAGGSTIDLSGIAGRLDKISNQLTKQNNFFGKLDSATASETANPIPTDASNGDWTSFATTWDNIKSSYDSVVTKGDELTNLVNGGFSLSLTGGELVTCPYNSTIDLVGTSIPVSFDLCKAFSLMRPVLYTMFYLIMVFTILSTSIKYILRMV